MAQPYPTGLCKFLARSAVETCGFSPPMRRRLDIAGCARVMPRVGEAGNPGPPPRVARAGERCLDEVELIQDRAAKLGSRVWVQFCDWINKSLGPEVALSAYSFGPLLAQMLVVYAKESVRRGGRIYEFRHLLAYVQREFPSYRADLYPAWKQVTRWEVLEPVQHRPPLPEAIFRAAIATAIGWSWWRWAAITAAAFVGVSRPGEPLRALRSDLVLPSDLFLADSGVAYMGVRSPKGKLRGLGKLQHFKVQDAEIVALLEVVFAKLDRRENLYSGSAASYRRRWDAIMEALSVPRSLKYTPGSLRGGGAVAQYRKGVDLNQLMWAMRIKRIETLQHYLQEATTEVTLAKLPQQSRTKIQAAAGLFPHLLRGLPSLSGLQRAL